MNIKTYQFVNAQKVQPCMAASFLVSGKFSQVFEKKKF